MSRRPLNRKRANRLRKLLRRTPPTFIDLVDYLKSRGYAQTTGEAERIILAGRVKAASHTLGITKATVARPLTFAQAMAGRSVEFETRDVVKRLVPASLRNDIQVLPSND